MEWHHATTSPAQRTPLSSHRPESPRNTPSPPAANRLRDRRPLPPTNNQLASRSSFATAIRYPLTASRSTFAVRRLVFRSPCACLLLVSRQTLFAKRLSLKALR